MDRSAGDTLVVVALPSEEDYVRKISSEKVPHMTILYLGKQGAGPTVAKIASFLEHAVDTSLTRFGLSVDRRGVLGDDKADVLFFEKQQMKKLEEFRSHLLKNDEIFKAYSSAEQFPSWIPHLTLGYPESPAKEDDREYPGINWVRFDRIALWTGDSEGPEYILKEDRSMELAMSSVKSKRSDLVASLIDEVGNRIVHFGVKGMRWGVRRSPAELAAAKTSKSAVKKGVSEDHALLLKPKHQLTNEELQSVVNRMRLNQELARLTPAPPKGKLAKGSDIAKDILGDVGKTHAKNVSDYYIGKLIKKKLGIDPPEIRKNPKKDKPKDEKPKDDSSKKNADGSPKGKSTKENPQPQNITNNYYTTYGARPDPAPTAPTPPKYTSNYNDQPFYKPSEGPRRLMPPADPIYKITDLND